MRCLELFDKIYAKKVLRGTKPKNLNFVQQAQESWTVKLLVYKGFFIYN